MIQLSVVFGDGPASTWRFLFQDPGKALAAHAALGEAMKNHTVCQIEDDLGQRPMFDGAAVRAVNLEDPDHPEMRKVLQDQRRQAMMNNGGSNMHLGPRPPLLT